MNIKPILFSSPMVRATLDGTKTQTRRIVKASKKGTSVYFSKDNGCMMEYRDGWGGNVIFPKYKEDDILWVRETTKVGAWRDEEAKVAFDYKASPELKKTDWCHFEDLSKFEEFHLKLIEKLSKLGFVPTVDEENEKFYFNWEAGESPFNWTPSIFMPKEACRIFLKATNIRIERVQDISEEDAISEGIEEIHPAPFLIRWKNYLKEGDYFENPIESFKSLWISINGKKSWDKNPYVFVYDFKKTDKPKNFIL